MGAAGSVTRSLREWDTEELASFLDNDDHLAMYAEVVRAKGLNGAAVVAMDAATLGDAIGADNTERIENVLELLKAMDVAELEHQSGGRGARPMAPAEADAPPTLDEQRKQDSLDLLTAIKDADEPRVAELLTNGADADYYAVRQLPGYRPGNDEAVASPLGELAQLILEKDGPTAVHVAILRRLFEAGADVNRTINASGKKVLADGEHVQVISCAGIGEFNPLDVFTRVAVARNGPMRLEPLELTIRHGANVNHCGSFRGYHWATTHIAVAALDQPVTELLLHAGADLTVANVAPGGYHNGKRGSGIRRAPIHQICHAWTEDASEPVKATLREFLTFLVEHGAEVNLEDRDVDRKRGGSSLRPMQIAMIEGKHELADTLAKLGGATPDGWTIPEKETNASKAKQGAAKGKKKGKK